MLRELGMNNHFWLNVDGTKIILNGHEHILKVTTFKAIYPYAHQTISVTAEPLNKNSDYYIEIKHQLGDEWVTDVFGSFETECDVLHQLQHVT